MTKIRKIPESSASVAQAGQPRTGRLNSSPSLVFARLHAVPENLPGFDVSIPGIIFVKGNETTVCQKPSSD